LRYYKEKWVIIRTIGCWIQVVSATLYDSPESPVPSSCCGIRNQIVGAYALIGFGAVVTKDVPPFAGNPARLVGILDKKGNRKIDID